VFADRNSIRKITIFDLHVLLDNVAVGKKWGSMMKVCCQGLS
jgi:hypothetical protein